MLTDPNFRAPLAISLGAIAGALCRYYLTLWFTQFGVGFPSGTFFINLTGCLVMGFFVTLASERIATISPDVQLLVKTGFLGAYTTFSTYGLESLSLLNNRAFLAFGFYWLGSAVLGLLAVQLGTTIARW